MGSNIEPIDLFHKNIEKAERKKRLAIQRIVLKKKINKTMVPNKGRIFVTNCIFNDLFFISFYKRIASKNGKNQSYTQKKSKI